MSRPDHAALRDYLAALGASPRLSADEERALARRVAGGDPEARDLLARANLRLVVALARGYAGRGLAPEDLVAEGNLGLMRAVETYDGRAGVRFGSYAAHWIKQSIRRLVINQGEMVRLPGHAVTLLAKWRRAEEALAGRLGREPEPEEVGAALGLSARKLAIAREALAARALARREEAAEAGPSRLEEVAAPDGGDPLDRLGEAEARGWALAALGRIDGRQAEVIRLRFGLGGEAPLNLRQIGERLGLTRERVRQLERRSLAELAEATAERVPA